MVPDSVLKPAVLLAERGGIAGGTAKGVSSVASI